MYIIERPVDFEIISHIQYEENMNLLNNDL